MLQMRQQAPRALLFVMLFALLAGCYPPGPTPVPTEDPNARIQSDCQARSEKGLAKQREVPRGMKLSPYLGLIYADDQVLVAGNPKDIADLISKSALPLKPHEKSPGIPVGKEVIQLYDVDKGFTVEQVTCLVNSLAARDGLNVYSDPNYNVTPAGWHGGGSPWTQNGQWAQQGGGLGTTDRDGFLDQWAFGEKGIALFEASGKRTVSPEGKGIVIGVFDTSPFAKTRVTETLFNSIFGATLSNPATSPARLVLHDVNPQDVKSCPGLDRVTPSIDRETYDLSSHGLFVSGLAHAVAPQSDIYLVRVLADDACGDLNSILQGLQWFQEEMKRTKQPMEKTVINLSLGLNRPDAAEAVALGLPPGSEVRTLQAKIQELMEQGATVVAAAGNDSFDKAVADPAEIPAQDKGVIAVAASTINNERSCYSNEGLLAAPGGNGVGLDNKSANKKVGPNGKPICLVPGQISSTPGLPPKETDRWTCEGDETLCVVSLVWRNGKPQFAYWVGTSFATPMVSGLAALAIESQQPQQNIEEVIQTGVTPVDPSESIGLGIINVDRSFPN